MNFGLEWIEAFNAHDLPRILGHYAASVELISPLYREFTAGRTDTARGLDELEAYFGAALTRWPRLRFTLLDVATGTRGLCVRYHTNLGDRTGIECFELDDHGRAVRVLCHYTDALP